MQFPKPNIKKIIKDRKTKYESQPSSKDDYFNPDYTEQILIFIPHGRFARILEAVQDYEENGIQYRKFILRPTPGFRRRANIGYDDEDGYDNLKDAWVKKYPLDYVIDLDTGDPKTLSFGILCTWDGKPSDKLHRWIDSTILPRLKSRTQQVKILSDQLTEAMRLLNKSYESGRYPMKQLAKELKQFQFDILKTGGSQ